MYQIHSQPKQQQYITLLDKCTQILREDRIWLRNMLKSGHEQTISLFRGLPRNVDMKELQIKLRKFITRAKQRQKQQQLQRFKQNMQLPEFVELAAEKRQQDYFATVNSKDQQQYQARRPLIQNEHNHQERSSFAAKWNNYSHYNHSTNYHGDGRHIQQQQQQIVNYNNGNQSRPLTTSTTKKEWQNNYKPHSFNKNINYEMANKLSLKNSSTVLNNTSTSKSKHNLSTSSLHKGAASKNSNNSNKRQMMMTNTFSNNASSSRRQMMINNQEHEQRRLVNHNISGNGNFGQGRGSSKSLKQLQNRIYQQLKQFQQNKNRRQSQSSMSKEYSHQKSIQKHQPQHTTTTTTQKQKPIKKYNSRLNRQQQQSTTTTQPLTIHTPSVSTVSKQSIDQILKFKLGNCDFQSYKRQQSSSLSAAIHDMDSTINHNAHQQPSFCNISQLSHVSDAKVSMSSQKKLYYNNDGMFPPIEEQTERDSESQRYLEEPLRFGVGNGGNTLRQELEDRHKMVFASFAKGGSAVGNELAFSKQYGNSDDIMLNSFNPQQLVSSRQNLPSISINSPHEQLPYQKNISQSLYQSEQKQSDFTQNFIDSDLHKSIMQSIKKSREMYPLEENNVSNNNNYQPQSIIPTYQPTTTTSQIITFPSSLYGSTNQQQSSTLFTSPQLLNECRNFLKKTQQINFQNSGLSSNFNSNMKNTKFQSPTNSQQKKSFNFQSQAMNNNNNANNFRFQSSTDNSLMMNFPQPITITQSITKDYYENYGQSYSQAKINSMFESKQSIVQKNIQFQTYSKPQDMNQHQQQELEGNGYDQMVRHQNEEKQEDSGYGNSEAGYSNKRKDYYQQIVVGGNSSSQKHSQIEDTIAANNNKLSTTAAMQFSHHSRHSRNHSSANITTSNNISGINRHQYYIQNDQNYRTSEFKQIEMDNRPIEVENYDHNDNSSSALVQQSELYEMIQIEDVIDRLLEANQGNLEMDSTWLKHTIANHCVFQPQVGKLLSHLLHQFIIQSGQTHNFIDLLDVIYAYYRASNPHYHPRKSPAADICALLDIQQKGYIIQEDLQNFIAQLQSAGVENIDEICHHLQETFEMADFLSIKRIGFVNLYVIKNQDCFDALWGELQQFEFEVEGDQQ